MLKMNQFEIKMAQKQKQKLKLMEKFESSNAKNNKFLIKVNVVGSAGPIRIVVNEKDVVSGVIETSLKTYAKEGRLPVLGTHVSGFLLYPAAGSEALNPSEPIGSHKGRNFVLCKKQIEPQKTQEGKSEVKAHRGSGSWKAMLTKSFSFKILSR